MLFFTYQIYNLFIRLCKINTASVFLRYFEFEKEKIKSVETVTCPELAIHKLQVYEKNRRS